MKLLFYNVFCFVTVTTLLSVRHFLQPIAADFYYLGVLDSLPCIMSIRRGMVLERNRACVELLNLLLDLDLNFLLRQCLASSKSKPQDDVSMVLLNCFVLISYEAHVVDEKV